MIQYLVNSDLGESGCVGKRTEAGRERVCVRERARCVCVCVCVREREREIESEVNVCVSERKCVCV